MRGEGAPAAVAATSPNRQSEIANRKSSAGLVLDYSLVSTTSNYTFKGDTTYFIQGATLSGTNIIEGGAVLKMGGTLTLIGPLVCRTAPYLPAILTSVSDDTVGETITGYSTGNPWTNYAAIALKFDGTSVDDIKHLRFSHLDTGVTFDYDNSGAREFSHLQFVHCHRAFELVNATVRLRNVLMVDVSTNFAAHPFYTDTVHGEHVTFCRSHKLADTNGGKVATIYLTNSLLVAVTNTAAYSGANNASNSDPAAVFQTVGAGSAYLLTNTFRNLGTTNINPTLLAELRQRTTYPPIVIGTGTWYTNNLTLSPQAQRDTDTPDLGYLYDPLDYVLNGVPLTNATFTVLPGTALGMRSLNGYALALMGGASFLCEGAPTNLNRIVRYNTVQEQANTNWTTRSDAITTSWLDTTAPILLRCRFTEWSVLARDVGHFAGSYGGDATLELRDCQFYGGQFSSVRPTITATNNLFHRVTAYLDDWFGSFTPGHVFQNNLHYGGIFDLWQEAGDGWTFRDNFFVGTTNVNSGSVPLTADYNAYTTNVTRLNTNATHDVLLATNAIAFDTAALGRFYLPTNGPATNLFDRGSTNADALGLWHYAATADQVKETNSIVDIGFHPVAFNLQLSTPFDTDGEGLPDYVEDKNGNGLRDATETDLTLADTDGDQLTDYEEVVLIGLPFCDPLLADTDGDGITDGREDFDNDGITTLGELRWANADPLDAFALNRRLNGNMTNKDGSFLCTAPLPGQSTNSAVFLTISNLGTGFYRLTLNGATPPFTYDIFRNTNFIFYQFHVHRRGTLNQAVFDVPQEVSNAVYVAGAALDRDGDGLSDGYECLISGTILDDPDTDNDGLPDGWERFHGLNAWVATDGTNDLDGDGISNLQEYLNEQALTRPREPLGPSSRRTPLVISEIMYHPAPGGTEFVELYNSHHLPQRLDGFHLVDAGDGTTNFIFGSGVTLAPRGFTNVNLTNSLGNGGDRIQLRNAQGAVMLEVSYSDEAPWPKEADGAGHSLVLARPSFGEGDPRAWAASEQRGGSPGFAETNTFDVLRYVKINEFLANPSNFVGSAVDYIELYNTAPFAIDLSGCLLACTNNFNMPFTIPSGTVIPARGFVSWTATASTIDLKAAGEDIFFASPGTNRVLDALNFLAQADGISTGRFPDGAPGLQELAAQTPGTNNGSALTGDIVINEIMFNAISGTNWHEYVELYNRGTNAVNMHNWKLRGGVSFTISNFVLAPDHYLVIAKDTNTLLARYPADQLVLGGNLLGNYSDSLGNGGDRLTLLSSSPGDGAVMDEVTFGDGGRWGKWADGGGSSLELLDTRSDNRQAPNWGDSDETSKGAWTLITFNGVLDLGKANQSADSLEITLQGAGEWLLDDIQCTNAGIAGNLVSNGTFEAGTNGWLFQGTHDLSSLETNTGGGLGGFNSSSSLHLRASGRGGTGGNRLRAGYTSTPATGTIHRISAQARWLRGETNLVLRTHGNWLEAAGSLMAPTNLGSPALVNSRFLTNTGPAIYDVAHSPVLPAANQIVLVTARLHDPDGVTNVVLRHRIDPSATVNTVVMNDAGTNGDARASDGVFSGKIPGQSAGKLVAFRVEAADVLGATKQFPTAQVMYPGDTEQCEGLVRFGEPPAGGSFGTYRMWMTAATSNQWFHRLKLHNSPLDITFVYNDSRAIYNAGALYSGSPATALEGAYDGPMGVICGYELAFPSDDMFLGSAEAVLDWPIRDNTAQREQVAYWIAEQMGLRPNLRRFVHLRVNGLAATNRSVTADFGSDAARIYEDTQQPGSDYIDQSFPGKNGGELHKLDQWVEFSAASDFYSVTNVTDPTLGVFNTTNALKKLARYRWIFPKRGGGAQAHNYDSLFKLVDAVNTNANYTTAVTNILDADQWMRVWAFEDVVVNSDSFGNGMGGKNMFMYRPSLFDPWQLLLWDLDLGLGDGNTALLGTNDYPLFTPQEPINYRLNTNAPFLRVYWRGLQDAVNGPLQSSNYLAVLNANYAALTNNGVTLNSGNPLKQPTNAVGTNYSLVGWIDKRRNYLNGQLNTVNAAFAITNNNGNNFSTNGATVLLGGTAPVSVANIRINSTTSNAPVSWPTVTNWTVNVTLTNGANPLTVRGYDGSGVSNAVDTITITKF